MSSNGDGDARNAKTLVELLRHRAAIAPARCIFTFISESAAAAAAAEESQLTHFDLDRRARAIAARLQHDNVAPGDRVLLLYPPGFEYICAFFGCLYAGAIAVPTYPPRRDRDLPRLEALQADAGAAAALTTSKIIAAIGPQLKNAASLQRLRFLPTDDIPNDLAACWREPNLTSQTVAFLQYTSGSTRTPRGVILTHANVLANCALIHGCFESKPQTQGVFWLPFYHDMGLIGGILETVYCGASVALMAPLTFLQSPFRWLETISKLRADVSGGPNFAYELCVRSITPEQRAMLDLSCWQLAFNGAEPVRAETLDRFADMFAPCGFRREAFYPCYGLAEATLIVAGGKRGAPAARIAVDRTDLAKNRITISSGRNGATQQLVSSGRIAPDIEARIIDPDSHSQCPPATVGEIWLRGPAVAQGYWNNPDATHHTFRAHLAESPGQPWLRTGDSGCLYDGELYVTGRLKDLIIIRGLKHHAHDIERTVETSDPILRAGGVAAVSIPHDGVEQLAIVVEAKRQAVSTDAPGIAARIAAAVREAHALPVDRVVFVKPGGIPRTSSGKMRRGACRDRLLAGELETLTNWTGNPPEPATPKAPEPQQPFSGGACPARPTDDSPDRSRQTADNLIQWLRDYATTRINSRLIDERRTIPPYVVLDFGNRGLLGMQIPLQYGGLALRNCDLQRVVQQLAAIDLTLASFVGVNHALGVRPILRSASPALREELLPILARGRELAAFALTEPGAGSNPRAIAATATPDGPDAWRLRGVKSWVGSGSWAGVINVFVRLGDGITAFAIRQGTPGLRQGAEALTMGMRGMVQNAIHLEDVRVTRANLLGEVGQGFEVAQDAMLFGRLGLGAMSVGGMKRCAQLMLRYAGRRQVATGRLLDNPVTRHNLAQIAGAAAAVESLVTRIAELMDQGRHVPPEAFVACKIAGPEYLWFAADSLMQTLGGRGYIETNIAPQLLRDARLLRIFEGPTETLEMFLGASATGDTLSQFISNDLGAPQVAQELKTAVAELTDKGERGWVLWQAGKLATHAILWAASGSEWARRQFQKARPEIQEPPTPVAGYQDAIGDLEQTLPCEDHDLDPMLRRDAAAAPEKSTISIAAVETDVTGELRKFLAKTMRLPEAKIDISRPLHSLGMDSLVAVELKHHVEQRYGAVVSITAFLGEMTLAQLAAEVGQPASPKLEPAVEPRHDEIEEYALSHGQKALWLLHELDPQGCAYNVGIAFEVSGRLDIVALEAALQAVVQRHPSLRTTFHLRDGQPVQRVAAKVDVRLLIEDARGINEPELRRRASNHAKRPFDLAAGPLVRAVLYQQSVDLSLFLLVLHHIIEDSWSLGIILYEISQLYRTRRRLPAVGSEYRDFVRWQGEMLAGGAGEADWAYWREQLAGAPVAIDLPTDRPRPPVQGYRGATFSMPLQSGLVDRLKGLGQAEGVTLYTTMLAGFSVLLHRYSRQDDICIGSPMTCRGRAEWARTVGYFVNPVVLRARFPGEPTFLETLRQMREVVRGALEHQDYPFGLLVERLQPRRDPTLSPLFQVMFTLQKGLAENVSLITGGEAPAGTPLELSGAALRPFGLEMGFAQFDLSLMVTESAGEFRANFEYNVDLFDAETVARMGRHFETLLESAAAAPDERVALLQMMSAAEQRQLMEWAAGMPATKAPNAPAGGVEFSLFYFSCNEREVAGEKYRLLMEGARFADRAGFAAVWTPERHFHAFGGLYPNPSVLGSALAMVTTRVRIRAGSVVLPLHHPLRVAEEWAVVDNLSNGRVDLAFARGWNAMDFVLAPDRHAERKQAMVSGLEAVRRLWRGEAIAATDGTGAAAQVRAFPLPVQKELPVWITCVGSAESFVTAAELGANVLTALLLQSMDELKERIALYRETRARLGYDAGHVTVMLHTLVGEDLESVRAAVREPFMEYLRSSVDLWSKTSKPLEELSERERADALAYGFERYSRTAALFGTPASCAAMVEQLHGIGVNEIACLIDFGVDEEAVLSSLKSLDVLRRRFEPIVTPSNEGDLQPDTIHGLIGAQVARTPDAMAVVYQEESLSYRELEARANGIAADLRRLGIGAEERVGLCIDRSLGMVAAVLGVLKAGGAYVPLDPTYPAARLSFMIEDAGIGTVICSRQTVGRSSARAILIDEIGASDENVDAQVSPEQLAYVMYTSGSTGRPKGVQVAHGAVVNLLAAMREEAGIGEADRLLAVTRLSFDIAGLELLLPLTVGGTVVIASEEVVSDPLRLMAALGDSRITVMQATPGMWRMMLDAGWGGNPGLKMLCGGEALSRELAERLLPKGERLWNLYGPTETTIWSAVEVVESGEGPVSIGRPIARTQLYVMDGRMRPLPVGVAGELYIGGAGLARGYLNQPELTAERFVCDASGRRLYRTGDLVKRRADGRLDFLGRMDQQVKIRGYRIELEEIEVALAAHPAVGEALVVAREEVAGDQRLVAYFIADGAVAASAAELRSHLRERLPEYMVPGEYVAMERWPLTANGKIDRGALPRPQDVTSPSQIAVPCAGLEADIAAVWREVLRVERVGANQNFFELGGHSLLMAQVYGRLRERLKLEVSMVDLFRYPTVGSLAGKLASAANGDGEEDAFRAQVDERVRLRRANMRRRV
jgi:natural product biosynthesis luciferase-like monooxygenase protein/amino acid adenylation domain-containing protein